MTILRRDDGVQFVLQPYRELLKLKKNSLLKRELYLLGENHGTHARIFKREDNHYEAIFARDSGYLLGEAVWCQLNKPQNLFYCEALHENQILVVIVRDGIVHLDTVILREHFAEELAFLLAEKTTFAVHIYGDVPLSEQSEEGKLHLDALQIKSFVRLSVPLFNTLSAEPNLRLLPLEKAVAELNLDQQTRVTMLASAIAALLLVMGIWWNNSSAPNQDDLQNENPYLAYQQALTTPSPAEQLNALTQQINLAYNAMGWLPTKVEYNNGHAQFEMHTMGSSFTALMQWAAQQNATVNITNDGALLILSAPLTNRQAPEAIQNTQQILATVIDRMMQVLPGKVVQMGTSISHGMYQEKNLTITLQNFSPQMLPLIGRELADLPVVLTAGKFNLNNGILSGTLQLTVLGN